VESDPARPFASVSIVGDAAAVSAAARRVEAIVNPPTAVLTCDSAIVGALIGPQGANIKRLQAESGAHVNVQSDRSSPFATITVCVRVCAFV
jgi:polyribonucleotide nucleotidyltransferase